VWLAGTVTFIPTLAFVPNDQNYNGGRVGGCAVSARVGCRKRV
jgi:hypothetical protein